MNEKELKQIFGDKLKTIEIRPEKIDFEFSDFAVYVKEDFSCIDIVPAHIHESQLTNCYGVIPECRSKDKKIDANAPFNCFVGDYKEYRSAITLDLSKFNESDVSFLPYFFGAHYVYATKKNIYRTTIPTENLNEFFQRRDSGYYGFFNSKRILSKAYSDIKSSYVLELTTKLKSVQDDTRINDKLIAML